ncbi:MAG: rod shape-determining protein MreC [bacterium]|nr:rod shape-determining protein MreC [bacterium]
MLRRKVTIIVVLTILAASGVLFFRSPILFRVSRALGRIEALWQAQAQVGTLSEALGAAQAERDALGRENAFLRQSLNVDGESRPRVVLARVLGVRPGLGRKRLIVDQGSAEGIEEGVIAFLPLPGHHATSTEGLSGTYVGRTVRVGEHNAEIQTVLDAEYIMGGQIRQTPIQGIVQARFGTGLVFRGTSEGVLVRVGQEVSTVESDTPGTFLLGTIGQVDQEPGQVEFTAALELPYAGTPEFVWLFKP